MPAPNDMPHELREVLTGIAQALLESNPLPDGDYGTAPFDRWLRISKTNRHKAAVEFLDQEVQRLSNGRWAVFLTHPENLGRHMGMGLPLVLVAVSDDNCHQAARHFCVAAANINGVYEQLPVDTSQE